MEKSGAPRTPALLAKLAVLTVLALAVFVAAPPGAARADPGGEPDGSAPADLAGTEELVDEIVPEQLADGAIPGAVVTVVADGHTVLAKGYGTADVSTGAPMDADITGFHTASEAKLFTATAALQLVDAGKLDLHADVNDYLDTAMIPDTYPGRPVTLHHLLTYTSGFDYDVYGWSQWEYEQMPSLGEFVEQMMPERVREPGRLAAYNNFDYVLIGRLVEIASGQTFADYTRQHVFDPLGMDATTTAQPHPEKLEAALAPGHRPDGDGQTETGGEGSPVTSSGADTITSSADMAAFMIAQLEHDPKLGNGVAQAMQEQQFSTHERLPGVGYAFEHRPRNGQSILFKDGDLPGTHNNLALLPDAGVGIHVVYNGDGHDGAAFWGGKELIGAIVDEYFPADAAPEQKRGEDDVSRYAGEYEDARTSRNTFARVTTLMAPVTVEATAPGELTTTGMSEDPSVTTQEWVQIEPGLFESVDGAHRLAFTDDGAMVTSQTPTTAYVQLAWYESPGMHLIVFGLAVLTLVVGFLWFPVQALIRRIRGREPHGNGAKIARILAWTASLGVVMFAAGFALVTADPNRLMELPLTGDPALSIALNSVTVVGLLTVAVAVAAVVGWVRRWWTVVGRLAYSVFALAAIGFMWVTITYQLIGLPYTLTV